MSFGKKNHMFNIEYNVNLNILTSNLMCTYTMYNIPLGIRSKKLGRNGNKSMELLLFDLVFGCTSRMSASTYAGQKKIHISIFFTTSNKYNLLENMT